MLKLAGMNLVGRDSGVSVTGRRWQSKRGRPMLRRQLYLLAGWWSSSRGLLREEYPAMVQRNGQLKTKAVCAMARKLEPVLFEVMEAWTSAIETSMERLRIRSANEECRAASANDL